MEVTLLLADTVAADWTSSRQTESSRALAAALQKWHATMRPVAPGASDSELRRYFVVDVPAPGDVESARRELARLPGVEAAYVKPNDALP